MLTQTFSEAIDLSRRIQLTGILDLNENPNDPKGPNDGGKAK